MSFWNFQAKFVFQHYTAYGTFHKGCICLTTSVSRTGCLSLPGTADCVRVFNTSVASSPKLSQLTDFYGVVRGKD
jgi:hypothetical protein